MLSELSRAFAWICPWSNMTPMALAKKKCTKAHHPTEWCYFCRLVVSLAAGYWVQSRVEAPIPCNSFDVFACSFASLKFLSISHYCQVVSIETNHFG